MEIALKKLHYRATMLKPRDVFDIEVIDAIDGDALLANLHEVAGKKDDLLRRLDNIKEDFLQAELAELDIRPRWEKHKKTCLETVRGIVARIPKSHHVNAQDSSRSNRFARYARNRKHLRFRSAFSHDVSEWESKIPR